MGHGVGHKNHVPLFFLNVVFLEIFLIKNSDFKVRSNRIGHENPRPPKRHGRNMIYFDLSAFSIFSILAFIAAFSCFSFSFSDLS